MRLLTRFRVLFALQGIALEASSGVTGPQSLQGFFIVHRSLPQPVGPGEIPVSGIVFVTFFSVSLVDRLDFCPQGLVCLSVQQFFRQSAFDK